MNINNHSADIIAKHRKFSEWKPARVISELVKAGMDRGVAEDMVKAHTPERKPHKPHNSHAKPVNMEDLSTHYVVIGDYELLELNHQDALIGAVRAGKGRSTVHDGAMAVKLFGLVQAYPIITTAEVNKHLNRSAFLDSIPLFIDGEEVAGEQMPSADNDYVKEVFRSVRNLRKIIDGLVNSGAVVLKKYLERVPTAEDVKRAVGIVAPSITNPYFNKIDYGRDYLVMPSSAHHPDSKRIIEEWKESLKTGSSRPRGRTLASDTDTAATGGTDA